MNILRRNAPETKTKSKEPAAEPAKSRCVKVTVERETVTVLVRRQPHPAAACTPGDGEVSDAENAGTEARPLELPAEAKKD
jgi:hypothetical protein